MHADMQPRQTSVHSVFTTCKHIKHSCFELSTLCCSPESKRDISKLFCWDPFQRVVLLCTHKLAADQHENAWQKEVKEEGSS